MATIGNEGKRKYTRIRDAFFTAEEKEFLDELKKDPDARAEYDSYLQQNGDVLCLQALALMRRVDRGEFSEEEMIIIERKIVLLLGAIQDLVYVSDEFVLDTDNELGRSL
ncbi:MAG: hypothetical protein IKC49_00730 [Clostridia bacterium]|nr:hypothetical protein [Clostridia bacterium]